MNDKARANRFYATATGGVIAVLLSMSALVYIFRPPLPDSVTLCPTTRPITAHTLVIVDRTDKWNPAISAALKELIENAQKNTQPYEKFSIVSLDSEQSTHPLFSVCNPGAPNFMTDLYRGRRYTKRDFDQKFVGAGEAVMAKLSEPSEASTSPIVEYVHRWLGRDDFNAATPNRRLILISDMRQNSPQYSIYTAKGDGAGLAPIVKREFGPAGQGVTYEVYFLAHGHDYNVSENEVKAAWDRAFKTIPASYDWRQID